MSVVKNVLTYEVNYNDKDRVHGVMRPVELLQELIRRFTYPGDTILDTFYGSGSALAAAASTGRRFLGCDQNPALRDFAISLVGKYYAQNPPSRISRDDQEQHDKMRAFLAGLEEREAEIKRMQAASGK